MARSWISGLRRRRVAISSSPRFRSESMIPAMTARAATNSGTRLGFVYIPHGAIMDKWTPKTEGGDFEFTPIQIGVDDSGNDCAGRDELRHTPRIRLHSTWRDHG